MEIIKKVTVKLTPDDLKEIITEYLKNKGMEVKNVYFNVNRYTDPDDLFGERDYIYDFENATCEVSEIN
jgi:hypothetical protein